VNPEEKGGASAWHESGLGRDVVRSGAAEAVTATRHAEHGTGFRWDRFVLEARLLKAIRAA
jgi:hypothetical protein